MMEEDITLQEALTEEEREEAIAQLQLMGLPTADISEDTILYLLWLEETPIGTAGLEIYGEEGLLRSISVQEPYRAQGLGEFIVASVEAMSAPFGVQAMNLLTESAAPFFAKQGYQALDRAQAPEAIMQSEQFAKSCPASAVFMRKVL
jgi:amino-acid N-acetyltransferase